MAETLFIRFLADSENVESLLVDNHGGRLGAVMTGPLADAAALALSRRVIALVPGSALLVCDVDLPAKSATKLRQMVPFALEEQLACDVDAMHFAIGQRLNTGRVPVVAVAHRQMQTWRAALASYSIAADAIYAESQLTPLSDGAVAVIDRGALNVRSTLGTVTTLDAQPLTDALALALPDVQEAVLLYVTQADYDAVEAALTPVRERYASFEVKLLPEGPLPLFALQALRSTHAMNLLQAVYEQRSSFKASVAPWRSAAALLAIGLALYLTHSGIQFWRLKQAEQTVDRQLVEVLSQTLPEVPIKNASMARRTFESRLNALKTSGGAGEFLGGLSSLSTALAQTPETHIEALAYRNKTIDLRVRAPSVDVLDKLRSLTEQSGMQSELKSMTPRDKIVEGQLQLKSAGA